MKTIPLISASTAFAATERDRRGGLQLSSQRAQSEIDAVSGPAIGPYAKTLAAVAAILAWQQAPLAAVQQPAVEVQSRAPLQGVVIDEATYEPIVAATVSLLGEDMETRTGRWGTFAFPDAPMGRVSLRVIAPGHPSVVEEVEVRAGGIAFVQFLLPPISAVLSELLVEVVPIGGTGPADPRNAADLLAMEVPMLRARSGTVGKNDWPIYLRAPNSLLQSSQPLILIDGVRVAGLEAALDVLSQIPAEEVAEIQVLKGPAAAFRYPFAANGVILVKTKTGSGGNR